MERYLRHAKEDGDFLGVLIPDEDSLPCIQREWRLRDFQDDLVDTCATAWLRLGQTVEAVLKWLGADVPPLSLNCRHASEHVQFKIFDRDELIRRMEHVPEG